MTAATLAISGIPAFAGFFSKDEILWRAYQASWAYWLVGVVTAFITSFYMFRLWFMTFFGEYRGESGGGTRVMEATRAAMRTDGHGHGGIHESPRVMVIPLVILAVLSVIGGYVGVPGSLGGNNRFDKFLGPVFHGSAPANAQHAAVDERGAPEKETEGPEPKTGVSTELMFTGISVFAALLGLDWRGYFITGVRSCRTRLRLRWRAAYQTLLHKYYVDELYGGAVRQAADRWLDANSVARSGSEKLSMRR